MTAGVRPLETGWLPDTPVGDTVLRRFLHNQIELNEIIAASRGGRVQRGADVSLVEAGPVTAFLNQAVLRRPLVGAADPVLDEVEAFYRNECTLLSLWPTPDLTARGWRLVGHPAFVVRAPQEVMRPPHVVRPPQEPAPAAEGAVVRRVVTASDLRECERILVDGYPTSPATDGAPTLPPSLVETAVMLRLALVDGSPVAVAASHIAHGVVNLCLAATLPAARRRGAWAALVRHRVADDPSLPAVAFTSDDSRPGFERLGFLPVTRFTLWAR